MNIKSEKDALEIFGKLMEKKFNEIILQKSNNIRMGTIKRLNANTRRFDIQINGTGELLNNVPYSKGASIGIYIGDRVLVISPDPKLRNQNYIVGIY